MASGWKQNERDVAAWFGTCRNPLSGRNNVDDGGNRRLGDIILSTGVVEVKRRKNLDLSHAKDTAKLASSRGLPWLVIEYKTGAHGLVKLSMTKAMASNVCAFIRKEWEMSHAKH